MINLLKMTYRGGRVIADERDWVSSPCFWQRLLLGSLAVPFLAIGLIFDATAVWAALTGTVDRLSLWIGLPPSAIGLVLMGASVLPVGRSRDSTLTILFVLFGSTLFLAIAILLLNVWLIRGR